MSSTPNWEQLFNKKVYCSTCGADITIDACDCEYDIGIEDDYCDHEIDEL